jgi:hypothetical protein
MKAEAKFRRRVLELLKPIGAFPIENADTRGEGTPDVATVAGFIELKVADRPSRPSTNVAIDLRNSQRLWLRRWAKHGGRAWTLTLLISDPIMWILHEGSWASENLGKVPVADLITNAIGHWQGGEPTSQSLIDVLMRSRMKDLWEN